MPSCKHCGDWIPRPNEQCDENQAKAWKSGRCVTCWKEVVHGIIPCLKPGKITEGRIVRKPETMS